MSQEAQWHQTDPVLSLGYVKTIVNDNYLVANSLDPLVRIRAKKAASCLLKPQEGDKVIVMLTESYAYIVHILERSESEATLLLPSQTQICLLSDTHTEKSFVNAMEKPAQSLKIVAQNMQCHCAQTFSVTSDEINTSSRKLKLGAHTMVFAGHVLYSRFESMRTACKHVVAKIHHYLGLYNKKIDHAHDLIEMKSTRTTIKNTESLRIQSKNAHIRAENSMDVDGKNIRIG